MTKFRSGTKWDFGQRLWKQAANPLLDVIKEAIIPSSSQNSNTWTLLIPSRSLKRLLGIPARRTCDGALNGLPSDSHSSFWATRNTIQVAKIAKKTSDGNDWSLFTAQELKTSMEEIKSLKEKLAKKTHNSGETLIPQAEQTFQEAELAWNQLSHVEAEVKDLCGSREELKVVVRRFSNREAEIARHQELFPKNKPTKRVRSYDDL